MTYVEQILLNEVAVQQLLSAVLWLGFVLFGGLVCWRYWSTLDLPEEPEDRGLSIVFQVGFGGSLLLAMFHILEALLVPNLLFFEIFGRLP